MTTRILANVSLIAVLSTVALTGACSDDDDDKPGGGRSGSTSGGSLQMGGDGSTDVGGGGSNHGGTAGRAGQTGIGGADEASVGGGGASPGSDAGGASGEGGGGGEGGAATLSLSDSQILLVLDTLNRGEVEEAYAVLPRLSDADVEAFAETMIEDHGGARLSVAETAQALDVDLQPSAVQRELEGESEANVQMLRATSTAGLDATYMNLQVAAHAKALTLLDQLADAADAAELTSLVAELTTAVQHHYDTAVEIEGEL